MTPNRRVTMASYIGRRKFLDTLGSRVAARGARAAGGQAAHDRAHRRRWGPWIAAFAARLRELGWIEGRKPTRQRTHFTTAREEHEHEEAASHSHGRRGGIVHPSAPRRQLSKQADHPGQCVWSGQH